ncbi:hypothetical protein F511_38095 [Dorcoceras hygrometricum]|uniref:Uncharacterized protein n=1 Tax=Dorcoceras hygrometricum TaxID=472368 RepID=A0A2Z7A6E3_9LAMI|nr:hypothetical protein F511_38095 [Dorcoceras hygrometricum]
MVFDGVIYYAALHVVATRITERLDSWSQCVWLHRNTYSQMANRASLDLLSGSIGVILEDQLHHSSSTSTSF